MMIIINRKKEQGWTLRRIIENEWRCDTVELVAIPLSCLPAWWSSVRLFCHFHRSSVPEESR